MTYQIGLGLANTVASIDDNVRPSSVGASITDEIHIRAFQLLRFAITVHGDHALPQLLGVLIHKVAQPSVNVPWRNAIDSSESTPFIGQRAG